MIQEVRRTRNLHEVSERPLLPASQRRTVTRMVVVCIDLHQRIRNIDGGGKHGAATKSGGVDGIGSGGSIFSTWRRGPMIVMRGGSASTLTICSPSANVPVTCG